MRKSSDMFIQCKPLSQIPNVFHGPATITSYNTLLLRLVMRQDIKANLRQSTDSGQVLVDLVGFHEAHDAHVPDVGGYAFLLLVCLVECFRKPKPHEYDFRNIAD